MLTACAIRNEMVPNYAQLIAYHVLTISHPAEPREVDIEKADFNVKLITAQTRYSCLH